MADDAPIRTTPGPKSNVTFRIQRPFWEKLIASAAANCRSPSQEVEFLIEAYLYDSGIVGKLPRGFGQVQQLTCSGASTDVCKPRRGRGRPIKETVSPRTRFTFCPSDVIRKHLKDLSKSQVRSMAAIVEFILTKHMIEDDLLRKIFGSDYDAVNANTKSRQESIMQ